MIIGGGKRAFWHKFAPHLMKTEDGQQQVRLVEFRGLASDNVTDAFHELEELGRGTRAKNFYYHANIDPRADEHMNEEEWEYAVDLLEKNLGFEGQPRFIVEHYHEDDGRTHRHVIWSRVDTDRMRVIPNEWDYAIHQRTADALEKELGHEKTPRTRDKGKPKGPANYEYVRGKETKRPVKEVEAEVSQLWRQADTPEAFTAALADKGYILCEGDRGLCIVDPADAKEHSLYRRVGLDKKDVDARMESIDREALPTVDEARTLARERSRGKDRDDAQPQSDRKKREAALDVVVEELAEAVHDAINGKGKARPQHDRSPLRTEAVAPEAKEIPGHASPEPAPASGPNKAAPRPEEPPPALFSPAPEPAAAPPPSLFERLAERLSQAAHALDSGPTVAEAADLSAVPALPSHDGVPLTPWQIPTPDRTAQASASTPFERLASELAREAALAAPVVEDLAVAAAAVAEHEPPSSFERLAQELTQEAAPVARGLAAEPELSAFDRLEAPAARGEELFVGDGVQWRAQQTGIPFLPESPPGEELTPAARQAWEKFSALRDAGGDMNLLTAAGIDWRVQQAGVPHLLESPPEGDLSAFDRLTWERFSATRDNHGEPVTRDGSFWRRARELLATALDSVAEWARERFDSFAQRLTHARTTTDRNDHERER